MNICATITVVFLTAIQARMYLISYYTGYENTYNYT